MKKILPILLFISLSSKADYNFYTEKECPIVGNTKTGIYHIPRGQFYIRMLKKNQKLDKRKCFQNEKEAIKHGFRKAKR